MGSGAVSSILTVALILAAVRSGFALPPGPAEAWLTTVPVETALFSLPEDQQSQARLKVRSAVEHFRIVRASVPAPSPATVRRYTAGIDRRPSFHYRLPAPRSAAADPVPH